MSLLLREEPAVQVSLSYVISLYHFHGRYAHQTKVTRQSVRKNSVDKFYLTRETDSILLRII